MIVLNLKLIFNLNLNNIYVFIDLNIFDENKLEKINYKNRLFDF